MSCAYFFTAELWSSKKLGSSNNCFSSCSPKPCFSLTGFDKTCSTTQDYNHQNHHHNLNLHQNYHHYLNLHQNHYHNKYPENYIDDPEH